VLEVELTLLLVGVDECVGDTLVLNPPPPVPVAEELPVFGVTITVDETKVVKLLVVVLKELVVDGVTEGCGPQRALKPAP